MLCLCHYGPALLRFCFQTNLGRENSASYLKIQAGRPFLTRVTRWSRSTSNFYALIGQNVTGEFMRKIYEAFWNLLLWQLDVQNEIQLLSRVFCYSWLVCLLVFWLRDASLVKVGNPISDGIVFLFHLFWLSAICLENIVKYCILSEVCVIKSTVSPQMWCLKSIKVSLHIPRFVGKIL